MRELTIDETNIVSGGLSAAAVEAVEAGAIGMSAIGALMKITPMPLPTKTIAAMLILSYTVGLMIGTYAVSSFGSGGLPIKPLPE